MASDEFPERIQFVYRDALDNIAFMKSHEWTLAGYGLAAQFGIVTVAQQMELTWQLRDLVIALIWMIPLYAASILLSFWHGMVKWRRRLDYVYKNCFTVEESESLRLGKRPHKTEQIFLLGIWFVLVVSAVLATAAVLHPVPEKVAAVAPPAVMAPATVNTPAPPASVP